MALKCPLIVASAYRTRFRGFVTMTLGGNMPAAAFSASVAGQRSPRGGQKRAALIVTVAN
jgi:hypothetical protein